LSAAAIAGSGMSLTKCTSLGDSPCSASTDAASKYRMFFGALIPMV
jgi:hypothetical protein